MKKNYIIIPTYNDWKSLNRLLQILNNRLRAKTINTNILLVNDCSKDKFIINKTNFWITCENHLFKLLLSR